MFGLTDAVSNSVGARVCANAAAAAQTFALQGLSPTTRYRLTNVRTGDVLTVARGVDLSRGLQLSLAPATALVVSVTPVGAH